MDDNDVLLLLLLRMDKDDPRAERAAARYRTERVAAERFEIRISVRRNSS